MIKVLKAGFYSTIQDQGRFGQREFGVPVSGAMDSYSSQFANALLANTKDAAVLEITMTGPKLQFSEPTLIAICGADLSPILNDKPVKMNAVLVIQNNDILSFGKLKSGLRAYLSVKGGFLGDKVLGSRSMYKVITPKHLISDTDVLLYKSYKENLQRLNANVKYNNSILKDNVLEAYKGPEFERLPIDIPEQLQNNSFKISKLNNRMAYQLEPLFKNKLEQILTAPVLPGTIQLTPSGQLIVLMRDCQTTGGYPRVLQLTEKAINTLSQKLTGSALKISLKD
jgi:antagonist of KipI